MKNQFGMQPTPHEKNQPAPYYPQDPIILQDWATYLDTVKITDCASDKSCKGSKRKVSLKIP